MSSWIRSKSNRELLTFLGGGVAAVVAAGWAVYVFVNRDKGKIEAEYTVCHGDLRIGKDIGKQCPSGAVRLSCDESIADWAKTECGKYVENTLAGAAGFRCGYSLVKIKCTANR